MKRLYFLSCLCFAIATFANGQRTYISQSVLATGNWYKIAVNQDGVYKIDASFLSALGVNFQNISSASIRLFGNGGGMLPEANASSRYDDLQENSIEMVDGGDGIFNNSDYFLFYSPGADRWIKDSLNKSFIFAKNLYSRVCYYYISIGGTGKRLSTKGTTTPSTITVTSFDNHLVHETDTINFLKSGKQWYGEEFSQTPGNTINRSFSFNLPAVVPGSVLHFKTKLVARSVGAAATFDVRINGATIPPAIIPAVSGNYLEAFASEAVVSGALAASQENIVLNYSFTPGSHNAQGWLDWYYVQARRQLSFTGIKQQSFRDWQSVSAGSITQFNLSGISASSQVWDVTNPLDPVRMLLQNQSFINDASRLREYFYFNGEAYFTPTVVGKINNQNLHQPVVADYIIITPAAFKNEANRLAAFHTQRNLGIVVATTEEVFNEFSSGIPDPTAIRDFVKMFYDRAGNDSAKRPKYLLLFGDASFDYQSRISNNTNYVPAYQSENSLDPLATYTSDDFFGLLDDADDINLTSPPALLDVGIGRVPASTVAEAKQFVDKIIHYHSSATLGAWRNQLTFVADDEDANLHLDDAEQISATAASSNLLFNQNKIYLDAFRQESGSGGSRYPLVNQAIINQMNAGNLIWNYNGHGGSIRLAEEAILDRDVMRQVNNANKLPLLITATCDFAPYDDPTNKSLGESLLLENEKGAIALTTTTRLVFAFSNRVINDNYLRFALQPNADGQYSTLGDALRTAKNFTYNATGDVINNRKFTLLGDPATRLAFPLWSVELTSVNGLLVSAEDTLGALEKCTVIGVIKDAQGNLLTGFNGTAYPTIFDKAQAVQTLANDAGSLPTTFQQQANVLYKGKATVTNGNFTFSFVVPKDINYQVGNGRMSLYADNGSKDANGIFTGFKIGGSGTNSFADSKGPDMQVYLNDENFVNGGLVNERPTLILKLSDSSGINTTGAGIGHDLTAVVDNDDKNLLVLNDFYEAELDDYKKGTVKFQLPELQPGNHTLKIKGWDVANNSSEALIEFVVAKQEALQISHVLNYPNPFTTSTNFWFEHNQPRSSLNALIQIYSLSGKLVHQIQKIINTVGNRSTDIHWDGTDSFGNKLARGVYIYRLMVSGAGGSKAEKMEKLYML